MGEGIQALQVEAEALCKSFVQGNVRGEWRVVSGAGMVVWEHRITNFLCLLGFFWGLAPHLPLSKQEHYERFGSQYVQLLQETRGRPRREEFMTKGTFSLDCFSFEMISSINESSPYPQTENVRRLEAFWKEYLFERK